MIKKMRAKWREKNILVEELQLLIKEAVFFQIYLHLQPIFSIHFAM